VPRLVHHQSVVQHPNLVQTKVVEDLDDVDAAATMEAVEGQSPDDLDSDRRQEVEAARADVVPVEAHERDSATVRPKEVGSCFDDADGVHARDQAGQVADLRLWMGHDATACLAVPCCEVVETGWV
jgi:hypothetical protein